MMNALWAGTILGAVLGVANAAYVYRVVARRNPADTVPNRARAVYFAGWTLVLWILFGGYVLVLWLAGAALYVVFKAFRKRTV